MNYDLTMRAVKRKNVNNTLYVAPIKSMFTYIKSEQKREKFNKTIQLRSPVLYRINSLRSVN